MGWPNINKYSIEGRTSLKNSICNPQLPYLFPSHQFRFPAPRFLSATKTAGTQFLKMYIVYHCIRALYVPIYVLSTRTLAGCIHVAYRMLEGRVSEVSYLPSGPTFRIPFYYTCALVPFTLCRIVHNLYLPVLRPRKLLWSNKSVLECLPLVSVRALNARELCPLRQRTRRTFSFMYHTKEIAVLSLGLGFKPGLHTWKVCYWTSVTLLLRGIACLRVYSIKYFAVQV